MTLRQAFKYFALAMIIGVFIGIEFYTLTPPLAVDQHLMDIFSRVGVTFFNSVVSGFLGWQMWKFQP